MLDSGDGRNHSGGTRVNSVLFASPTALICHSFHRLSTSHQAQKNRKTLRRWLTTKDYLLLLQRTQILFPEHMQDGSEPPLTAALGEMALCCPRTTTLMHKPTHMHTNESKFFFSSSFPCELLYKTSISLYVFLYWEFIMLFRPALPLSYVCSIPLSKSFYFETGVLLCCQCWLYTCSSPAPVS